MKKNLLTISILICFVFNNFFARAGLKPATRYREIAANYHKTASKLLKISKARLPFNPTVLTAGDIAVVGFNISNLKFSFVTLVTLNPGTVISFTDKGWTGTGFNTLTSEGTLTWTVGATVNAGTIVTVTLSGASPDVSGFPNGTMTYTGWSAAVFSNNGDEMIVFQGSEASPTFAYGFNSSSANGSPNITTDWQTGSIVSNRDSQLPTGLTNSTNSNAATAIAFTGQSTNHNWAYNGKTYGYTGTKSQLLTLIGDRANWAQSATALDLAANGTYFPTTFVVSAAGPVITTTGSLAAVNTTYGTPTATPTSFTVAGSSLTSNITVTLPTGFEAATSAAGTYSSPLTLTQSGGTYSGTVYVRLAANAAVEAYSGNITLSSTGATDKTVATANSTVTAAVLTYAANTASRAVGASDPTFTGAVTGFVNGENLAGATTGTAVWATTATVLSPAGSYAINGSGLSATNYTFAQAAGNATALSIVNKVLTINNTPTVTNNIALNGTIFGTKILRFTTGANVVTLTGISVWLNNNNIAAATTVNANLWSGAAGLLTAAITGGTVTGLPVTSSTFTKVTGSFASPVTLLPNTDYYLLFTVGGTQNVNIGATTAISDFSYFKCDLNPVNSIYRLSAGGNPAPGGGFGVNASGYLAVELLGSATVGTDASLSALTISSGTLSSAFTSATTLGYTASVANSVSSITVTPTPTQACSSIQVRVNGGSYVAVANATVSSPISLNVGANTIDVLSTTQDGANTTTYTITVTRAAGGPTITTTGTLAAVNTTYGTASATPTSFAVTGSSLTADISVTVPTGFEVSATSGGTYASTLTLTQTAGAYSGTVYVRIAASIVTGTYSGDIILSSAGATNATVATASSDVAKATLIYTATTVSKIYGDANPTFTGSITGFVNGQSVTDLTGTLAFTSAATTTSTAGTYAINGSGLSSTNYAFTQAAGNATALAVDKATLTYLATQASKTYGDANPTFTGTVTGFVNSENLAGATTGAAAWASPATVASIPGTYAINGSGLTATNYTFAQDAGNSTKFLINDFTTPTNPATNILFTNVSTGGFTASWTNGSGTSRALFIAAASSGSPSPVNNTTYTANTAFSSGTQIGSSGWYCVYNGTGSTVNITGLSAGTDYTVKVVEYNGVAGYEKYSPPVGSNNPKTQATNSLNTTITSIVRNAAALTNGNSVQYTATFAAAISGLTSTNFSLTTTGTLSGVSVTSVTGSGTSYTVTVNTGTGSGDLTLNLANATGLTPGISTSLPFAGQTYNVDKTAPDVSSGTFVSNNTINTWAKTGNLITLNFKANEKLQTPVVSIAGHTVTATNPSTDQINWTASYTMVAGDTEGLIDFSVTITDLAGNAGTEIFNAAGTHQTLALDKTAPGISIGSPSLNATNTGPVTYTITYSDTNFDVSTLSAANISLNKTGTADATGISVSGTGTTRTVTLTGISGAGTLGISIAAGTAKDAAGNLASASSASGTFTVTIAQTITFAATGTKTYGDADYDAGATSTNNGTAITYASDNTAVATIVSGKVHIVAVGSVNITASQAADATHSAATNVVQQLTVTKKDLTITANNKTKNYGIELVSEVGSQAFTTSGLVNGESIGQINVEYSTGKAANAAVGTYPAQVRPFQALGGTFNSANYTITYVKGDITVNTAVLNIAATGPTKEYGTAITTIPNSTINFSTDGLQNGETVTSVTLTPNPAAASATTSAGTPFGMAPSNAAGANGFVASNYHINYIAVVDFVKTKALTIAAKNANKTYGQELTSGAGSTEFTPTGLTNSETIGNVTIAYGTGANATAAVGTYTSSVTASSATGGTFNPANYIISYTAGDIIIGTKAIAVTAAAKNKTYGDADPALTYTNTPLVGAETFTGSLTRVAGENVGTYAIKQGTLALSSNYTLTYTGANLAIGTKTLAITADNKARIYGSANPTLNVIYTGFVNGDDESKLSSPAIAATTATTASAVGTYPITASGATSNNYTISYTAGTLSVTPAALTITADNKTKVYGGVNPALTAIYTGFINGDTNASLNTQPVLSTTATTTSAVGTYPITASGAASANYTISYTAGTLTVTKANLSIAADNKTKVYGAINPVLTITYTGFVNGDTNASLSTQPGLASTATAASAAGTYPITASGAASSNYNISYAAGTLTVNNSTLTITATNAAKTYGAANPTLAFTYSGFVNGDTQASLSTLPSVSTTATAASGAGTYPITAGGAVSANYALVYVPATLTVNKALLNVSADNKSRNYGLANPALTLTYSGFVNGDTQASLTTQATAVTNATVSSLPGTYAIIASGVVSANYSFSYGSGTFTIIPLTNASLANLTISSGTLSSGFSTGTFAYKASVDNATDKVTLTPTADPTATITINGSATGNGSLSAPLTLNPGDNVLTVVVTAQDGVTKLTYTVLVHRALPPAAIVPTNVLSPNGDGKNDAWIVKDIQLYPNNTVTIYDRAGRAVYSKKGYNNDWDGTLKGAPLAQGTYFYTIDLGPGYETLKGFITILKVH
jgi:gliding motility-associated-like protein